MGSVAHTKFSGLILRPLGCHLDEIRVFVKKLPSVPDFISLTETWLTISIIGEKSQLPGHHPIK